MESVTRLIQSSWAYTHGMKKWIWIHLLCPFVLVLMLFVVFHYSLTQEEIKALSQSLYFPMYGISLFVSAPFFCLALKAVIEKLNNRPYMFNYVYASVSSLWPGFGLAVYFVFLFYGVFAFKVWALPHIQVSFGSVLFQLAYDVIQLCVVVIGSLSLAIELRSQQGFIASLQKAVLGFLKHARRLLVLAVFVVFLYVCMSLLNQLAFSQAGHLLRFMAIVCSITFYIYLIPYQIVLIARTEQSME